ncbi:MAG: hypothetical protein WC619_00485 [Patescibacteria group bacterium]
MDIKQVKRIMGGNFIGPDELKKISSKLNIADPHKMEDLLPEIPFTLSYLEKVSKDYILILGIPEDKSGKKLTINRMRVIFGQNPAKKEPCFYNQDWYLEEKFAKDVSLKFKWYLIRKIVIKNSRGKNPEDIHSRLKEKENFPLAVLTVFVFFSYYFLNKGQILWKDNFIWCSDKDKNGDRIYTGRYLDPKRINKDGFNIHRHLSIRPCYGLAPQII